MDANTAKQDRREDIADVHLSFFARLEEQLEAGTARMSQIETELRPIKNMYWAVVGSGGIGALLLGLLVFIYVNDKNDFKDLQKAIVIQGEAIKGLMVSQANLEQSYRRDVDRIERGQDRVYDQSNKK